MRRVLTGCLLVAALLAPLTMASAGPAETTRAMGADASWLFIQTSAGLQFDGQTLTLTGVDPAMIMFSDRPHRVADTVPVPMFVDGWTKGGRKSFRADPPNAGVTTLVEGKFRTATVELTEPKLSGNTLTYRVKVLQGTVPPSGGQTSVFIDGGFMLGGGCSPWDPRC